MIEILKNCPDNVIALSCEGQVIKEVMTGFLFWLFSRRLSGTRNPAFI